MEQAFKTINCNKPLTLIQSTRYPTPQRPGQGKLDSDKWKLWRNLLELIEIFLNLAFGQVGYKKLRKRLWCKEDDDISWHGFEQTKIFYDLELLESTKVPSWAWSYGRFEFECRSWRGGLDITLCDNVC